MRVVSSVLLLLFALTSCSKDPGPAPVKPDKQALADAKDMATRGDLDGAHQKIGEIPIDSPVRQAPEVMEIEDRWAQARIANSDLESDATKRKDMLRDVANASIVRPDLRNKASNKLALLEAEPKQPELLSHADPKLAAANLEKCQELLQAKKTKEVRDLLYPRVTGGIGSPEERDMLLAICALARDKECLVKLEELGLAAKGTTEKAMKPGKEPVPSGSCAPANDH